MNTPIPGSKEPRGFDDRDTEPDVTPVDLRQHLSRSTCLRLDDGPWWEED